MFVTFICAVFDPGTGKLTIANGGHCRPVLIRAGEPPCWAVKNLGTALGFDPGLEFERTELTLAPGRLAGLLYRRRERGVQSAGRMLRRRPAHRRHRPRWPDNPRRP